MSLSLEIVTPDRCAWKGEVVQIQVPGSAGEFGVLENHANLLGTTRPGLVTLDSSESGAQRYIVGAGFAEVGVDGLTLLVDSCEEAGSYDKTQAATDLQEAESAMQEADPTGPEFERARNRVDLAHARIGA
jgi:F-type H+-transporting ATPase subunit epsilon